jgi:hypothetical protein
VGYFVYDPANLLFALPEVSGSYPVCQYLHACNANGTATRAVLTHPGR